jgi:hypothetical protein
VIAIGAAAENVQSEVDLGESELARRIAEGVFDCA